MWYSIIGATDQYLLERTSRDDYDNFVSSAKNEVSVILVKREREKGKKNQCMFPRLCQFMHVLFLENVSGDDK